MERYEYQVVMHRIQEIEQDLFQCKQTNHLPVLYFKQHPFAS